MRTFSGWSGTESGQCFAAGRRWTPTRRRSSGPTRSSGTFSSTSADILGALRRAIRFVAAGAVVAGVAAPLLRHRLKLPRPLVSVLAWQAPYALTFALPRTRLRDAGVYALQMHAYVAHYEMPNDDPDALLRRLRIDYPIKVDRALGGGMAPTVRLQRSLGGGE